MDSFLSLYSLNVHSQMDRCNMWREKLLGKDIVEKRELYYRYIKGRKEIHPSLRTVILADMPRTYPNQPQVTRHIRTIQRLLISYAAVQRGDSYLQGFNYIMAITWQVFKDTEHAEPDTWWCFARIVGLIRPLMPDFNVTWFHWMRRNWLQHFYEMLKKRRPRLNSILHHRTEEFSCLITVRWFMIWFAQTIAYEDLFKVWDFIIEQPPHLHMKIYTKIAFEIIYEAAPSITYQWAQEPTKLMHTFLNIQVTGIEHILEKIKHEL